MTAGDIYDALQEQIAMARTRALMGERCVALDLLARAQEEYVAYRDVLTGLPLHALDHALLTTIQILSIEDYPTSEAVAVSEPQQNEPAPKPKNRRKTKNAA